MKINEKLSRKMRLYPERFNINIQGYDIVIKQDNYCPIVIDKIPSDYVNIENLIIKSWELTGDDLFLNFQIITNGETKTQNMDISSTN